MSDLPVSVQKFIARVVTDQMEHTKRGIHEQITNASSDIAPELKLWIKINQAIVLTKIADATRNVLKQDLESFFNNDPL